MTEITERAGGCLCGEVRFMVRHGGEVHVCHCSLCRKATGGPMLAVICEGTPVFDDGSPVGIYHSSEQGERGFCLRCGSQLYFRHTPDNAYAFTAGTFDDQSLMVMTEEIYLQDKPGFYDFANETRRYAQDVDSTLVPRES